MRRAPALLPLACGCAAQPAVTLPGGGSLRGAAAGGVDQFLGVPFAEPPLAHLRWRAPAAKAAWTGERAAAAFGASCSGAGGGCGDTSEDCLSLNVYTPSARAQNASLPVLVWIHGGAYMTGCGRAYPAASLVTSSKGQVVVVTVNYRLNVFGFLGAAELAGREPDNSTGNYGIQDQRLALQWTKDNIAAFGGDAGNVMIFGESAGAGSVATHLVTPRSFGLYHKAVAESGAAAKWDCNAMSKAQATYAALMRDLKCGDVGCLVALDTKTIASAQTVADAAGLAGSVNGNALPFAPVVDGVELTGEVWEMLRDGRLNGDVPVMLGSNRDEFAAFIGSLSPGMGELEFDAYAEAFAGTYGAGAGAKIRKMYAPGGAYSYPDDLGKYSKWWWAAMRTTTDAAFVCPARRAARWLGRGGAPAVYLYLFAHTVNGGATVPHGCEIGYVFDAISSRDSGEATLASTMSSYWLNFATTGDPNGGALPRWPAYAAASDATQRLDAAPAGVTSETGLRRDACDLHDSLQK